MTTALRSLAAALVLTIAVGARAADEEAITNVIIATQPSKVRSPPSITITLQDRVVWFDVAPLDSNGAPVAVNGQYVLQGSVTWAKFLHVIGSTSTPNQAMNALTRKLARWGVNLVEGKQAE